MNTRDMIKRVRENKVMITSIAMLFGIGGCSAIVLNANNNQERLV